MDKRCGKQVVRNLFLINEVLPEAIFIKLNKSPSMDAIFNLKNYKIATLIFGFLLLFFSIFRIHDIGDLNITLYDKPAIIPLTIGLCFIGISIVIYFELGLDLLSASGVKIKKNKAGNFYTTIQNTQLVLHFDKIQDVSNKPENSLIILPANEYFDDECVTDSHSSLGAFVDKYFKNNIPAFQTLVTESLKQQADCYTTMQRRASNEEPRESYGIGAYAFLDRPLHCPDKILLVAVTQQRNSGLNSNIAFVFKAVQSIHQVIMDKRLKHVYIPLLGSGHGGLRKKSSLLALVTAIAELASRKPGFSPDCINIIIYKNGKKADIKESVAKKIMRLGVGFANQAKD